MLPTLPTFRISPASSLKSALAMVLMAAAFSASSQTSKDFPPTVTVGMGDVGGKLYGAAPDPATAQHYYIAAERVLWDFAPEGRDMICGISFPASVQSNHFSMKTRYFAYTDGTFTTRERENPSLGILGPVMRGVVGQNLVVTFWNRSDVPLSMHPHGLKYDKDSEGSYYQPSPGLGAAVAPGAKFTYVWQIDKSAGPSPSGPSSRGWLYHSHVAGDQEIDMGLVGFIIVTDPKRARADGTPMDVDRELGSLFMIFNENTQDIEAAEAEERARNPKKVDFDPDLIVTPDATNRLSTGSATGRTWSQLQELRQQGERYAINGRIFGNLRGLEMNAGERVRWYLFALGSENDLHTAHWHGLRAEEGGETKDVVELLPASMKVADMVADNPGSWLYHCHVSEHMMEGMFARVTVHAADTRASRRAPEPAFLGLPSTSQGLRIFRAEATVDFVPDSTHPCEVKIDGEVRVPEAYSLLKNTLRIMLGSESSAFQPGREGRDQRGSESFRAENFSKNSRDFGSVHGGWLKFNVVLAGTDLRNKFIDAGLKPDPVRAQEITLPFAMEIGSATHNATIQIKTASQ
jgi:manganese oxidase